MLASSILCLTLDNGSLKLDDSKLIFLHVKRIDNYRYDFLAMTENEKKKKIVETR